MRVTNIQNILRLDVNAPKIPAFGMTLVVLIEKCISLHKETMKNRSDSLWQTLILHTVIAMIKKVYDKESLDATTFNFGKDIALLKKHWILHEPFLQNNDIGLKQSCIQ